MVCADNICDIVKSHIEKKRSEVEAAATKLNPQDVERAKTIADKQLASQLGKRLTEQKRREMLAQAAGMVGINFRGDITTDEAFHIVSNRRNNKDARLAQPNAPSPAKKRKMGTSPSTGSRYAHLHDESDDVQEIEMDDDAVAATITPQRAKPVNSKSPIHSSVLRQNNDEQISNSHTKVIVHDNDKDNWRVEDIKDSTTVLVIGASNMRTAREVNLPADWEVHSFPGAKFQHAASIIDHLTPSPNLRCVVTQIGINHRQETPKAYLTNLKKMVKSLHSLEGVRGFVTGASFATSLPLEYRNNVKVINEILEAESGVDSFVKPLNPGDVWIKENDIYGVHMVPETVAKVIGSMEDRISLN